MTPPQRREQAQTKNMKEAALLLSQEADDYLKRQIEIDHRLTRVEQRIAKLGSDLD